MNTIKYITAICALMALTCQSCKENVIHEDYIDTEMNRKLAFGGPVINASFSVDDLMKELVDEGVIDSGVVTKDENDLLWRTFEKKVNLTWNSLVTLKDVQYAGNLQVPAAAPLKAASMVTLTKKIKMNDSGSRLDYLLFKAGKIRIDLTVPAGTTGTIDFVIPQFAKKTDATQFKKTFNLASTERTTTLGLSDYKATFAQGQDSSYVTLQIVANLTYTVPSTVGFNVLLTEMDYDEVYGFFGQKTEESKAVSLDFNFFKEYDFENKVQFADFQMEVESENYIGVPFKVQADSIWLTKGAAQPGWKLNLDKNYMIIDPAGSRTSINYFSANKDNSNIEDVGNKFPDKMVCNIKGISNPQTTTAQNFIKQAKKIENTLRLKFPFWFKTSLYSRTDEAAFDFNDIIKDSEDEVDCVESLKVHFDFNNRFPFDIGLQVEIDDENYNPILNLFPDNQVIAAAKPVNDGKSNEAVYTRLTATLTHAQIQAMKDPKAKKMIIKSNAKTYDNQNSFVKLYGSSRLDLKVSMELQAQLPSDL